MYFEQPFFNNSVKVTYTDDGVTEVTFQRRAAKKKPKDTRERSLARMIERYLDGRTSDVSLPIDWSNLEGTPFQKRVWRKMAQIPPGKTRTYGGLAKSLKKPGAARAVGTACGKNPVLLGIPCHRVVGTNGLGGFSGGGLGVKKKLLALEDSLS